MKFKDDRARNSYPRLKIAFKFENGAENSVNGLEAE